MPNYMAKTLFALISVIFVILAFILGATPAKTAFYAASVVYFVVSLVLLYFMRCPHCGAWPRGGTFFDEYCPKCGRRLDG